MLTRSSSIGILLAFAAAVVIGCGGASDSTPATTGATAGESSATGTTGNTGESETAEIAAVDLAFSDVVNANAETSRIRSVSDVSGVGFTSKGTYVHLLANGQDDRIREFGLDVPVELRAGASYDYASPASDPPIVATYAEPGPGSQADRDWKARSGTVEVVASDASGATLRFDSLRFSPDDYDGNPAAGLFSVSGTLRIRFVPATD